MNGAFYVTLPSNVVSKTFTNTQANFTTELSTPFTFNKTYEVSLVEFTFREFILVEIGQIHMKFIGEDFFRTFDLMAYENEPIDHFITRVNSEIIDYYSRLAYLQDNYPDTITTNQSLSRINKIWNDALFVNSKIQHSGVQIVKDNYNMKINECLHKCAQFEKGVSSNKITIKINENTVVKFSGHCQKLFHVDKKELSTNYEFLYLSEYLNFYDYLMVYCDIVEFQAVGDTFAPLLRTITKTGEFNHTTEKIFINPHYLQLNKSFISSINIDIRDPTGEPIKFGNETSKVLVKLHFRPA